VSHPAATIFIRTLSATSGEEALMAIAEKAPDLILLDPLFLTD
jgi:CheY-like chemotaxis protein